MARPKALANQAITRTQAARNLSDTIEVLVVSESDGGAVSYVLPYDDPGALDAIMAEVRSGLEFADPGQGYTIRRRVMSRVAYDNLPEFDGF